MHWQIILSPQTWQCNRPRISLKTSIDVPMLGDIIEKNGDGLLEESHMPTGWPLHIDEAVRQRCIHRDTTLLELDDLLSEYDMKQDLAEINRKAPQWSHKAVWNKWYMEPKAGHTLSQMWTNAEAAITQKTSRSTEIRDSDLRRVASAVTSLPTPQMTDSPFLKALGTQTIRTCPGTNRRASPKGGRRTGTERVRKQSCGNLEKRRGRNACCHSAR